MAEPWGAEFQCQKKRKKPHSGTTQTHLESVSQLDEECERLRTVNRDLKVQVQRWIEKASQLEQSRDEAWEKARQLVGALRESRNVLIVACGETAPYIKVALANIDAALDDKRVSKHSRIFTGADGSSFLGKE